MDQANFQLAVQATRPEAARSRQLHVPIHRERHPRYGLIEVTPQKVERMPRQFAEGVKTYHGRLPFSIDHDESPETQHSSGSLLEVPESPAASHRHAVGGVRCRTAAAGGNPTMPAS